MNHFFKIIICLSIMCTVVACDSETTKEVKQKLKNNSKAPGNDALDASTYTSDCQSSTLPNLGPMKFPGMRIEYKLSDLDFTKTQTYFSDSNCQDVAFVVKETGQINVVGESKSVPDALDENFSFEKTTIKIEESSYVSMFNTINACEINDWVYGEERTVSSNASQITCPGGEVPRVAQEIVLVEDNKMFLGSNASSEKRPISVDRTNPHFKH